MKNKQNYIILAIVITVALIPVAYSVTEPNIIIDMIASQTTNPFRINDVNGDPVFTIDSNGVTNSTSNPQIFRVTTSNVPITIETTHINTAPLFLWEVDIDRNGEIETQWHRDFVGIVFEGRRTTGSGTCSVGWVTSSDNGITWSVGIGPSAINNDGAFSQRFTVSSATNFGSTITNFGFGFINSDGATTCEVKHITSKLEVNKPFEWDFTVIQEP